LCQQHNIPQVEFTGSKMPGDLTPGIAIKANL
jgi:hypothetical protein